MNDNLFAIDEDKLIREDISSYKYYNTCLNSLKSESSRKMMKIDKKSIDESKLDAVEELCLYSSDISIFITEEYACTVISICNCVSIFNYLIYRINFPIRKSSITAIISSVLLW